MSLLTAWIRDWWYLARESWNRFWFTAIDPATLGLLRILTGWMLVYSHLVWSWGYGPFLAPGGMLRDGFITRFHGSPFAWSYLYGLESPTLFWLLHGLGLFVLVSFMLGFQTRWTGPLSFLITTAYSNRAVSALFGMDQIVGFLTLYLAIGPSGAAYSLDRWLKRRKTGQKSLPIQPSLGANVSTRLIQLHMCVVYFFAGIGKLQGETWWTGEALWGAIANYEYQTLDLTWLAAYPLVINFLTQLTVFWELSYAALIWPRLTRPIMIALAFPLHLGIAFGMGMITFGYIMIVGNLAFIPPQLTRELAHALAGWLPGRSASQVDGAPRTASS